ncbi:LCP family protein [Listeria grayi]|uniref:Cell envelope-like function transcriptional attenuator common domain protein n=1 Tax=Listeria grayi DSM 20601 TaxID=525367 RepID=D7UVY1_LISGR|nr:LCP family protein [Listeria grayi]EFI84772.1 cell envelope-like function transcriptional attenuator common domain protein [Listeria grayi DSM 20601]
MTKQPKDRSALRKYKKRRRVLYWVLIPLMVIVLSGVGYGTYLFAKTKLAADNAFEDVRDGKMSDLRTSEVEPIKDSFSILLIGVDTGKKRASDGPARSDSLILATFNVKENRVKMTSIPRDSYVHISYPKKDIDTYTKINAAHAYGGPALTMQTVQEQFKVPIDYYVRFNFDSFLSIVDALGGIDMDVPVTFTEQNSDDKAGAITLHKGRQHLNSEQALALARTRHIDNDIERGKRQQMIIKAIVKKASSISSISKYSSIIDTVGKSMKTNLKFDQMLSIAKYGMTHDIKIDSLDLKGGDDPTDTVYYYKLDENSVQQIGNEFANELDINKPFPGVQTYSEAMKQENKDSSSTSTSGTSSP